MVEPDLVSPVEHYLLARPFDGNLPEQKVSSGRWRGRSVCGHLARIRRDYGAVELFVRRNSTALCVAHERTPHTFNDDSARCHFPWVDVFAHLLLAANQSNHSVFNYKVANLGGSIAASIKFWKQRFAR